MQICSLSTIVREYIGLHSIMSLPFKDLILSAKDSSSGTGEQSWKIPRPLMEFIQTNHNESQLAAIHVSSYSSDQVQCLNTLLYIQDLYLSSLSLFLFYIFGCH